MAAPGSASPPTSPVATRPLVVDARGLRKHYFLGKSAVEVLVGVDLTLGAGEVVALRGPSGSGKSTLLNVLGCLDRPSGGRYILDGTDVSELSRAAQAWVRLHVIGFVFQSFNLIARSTALENVALPLFYAGVPRPAREKVARDLLAQVGLADRAHHLPAQLSGGQCQRVAIARALAGHPRLVLADEPTGALDSRSGGEVLELLLDLQRREGLTLVIVTHDAAIAARADRQVHLLDGRIVDPEVRVA
jgi:putative ABC transport system ATP-binding protein